MIFNSTSGHDMYAFLSTYLVASRLVTLCAKMRRLLHIQFTVKNKINTRNREFMYNSHRLELTAKKIATSSRLGIAELIQDNVMFSAIQLENRDPPLLLST